MQPHVLENCAENGCVGPILLTLLLCGTGSRAPKAEEGPYAHQESRKELHRRTGGRLGVAHLAMRSLDKFALDANDSV